MRFALAILALAFTARADELALPDAIRLALEKNPDLAAAQQRVAAARAGLQQVDAAFWPRVRVSESYAASDNPVQAFMMTLNQRAFNFGANFNHPDTTDNLNTKVLAQWSLFDGGRSLAAHAAAKLGAEAAAQSLEAARNDLVFEVTRAFHTVGKARQFLRTAEAAVASMEANAGIASNRFAAGTALKADFLDAQVRLSEARENLVRARNAVALSEMVFRNVLGVGEKENVTAGSVTLSEAKGLSPSDSDTTEILRFAQNDRAGQIRPELLAAQKAVAAAGRQVSAARSGYLPRLNAFASYDLDSGDASRFKDSWVAGVSVELDVFDGFLTRGKVAEARAQELTAREQLRKTELAIQLETKQAQLNLREAAARLDTTGNAVAQAEESLKLTKERYGEGLALFTQVLDAETALTSARQRRAAAEADYLIARAALDRALGRTWKDR
jgi:outer membrane protein TolC